MESAMASSLIVSPKAAEDEYRRNTENARIRYVLVSAQKLMPTVTVTPSEVDLYYAKNQAKYAHGEQRDLKYLVADTNRIRQTIKPGDEELRKRYEASKEDFKRTDSAHILHILIKVERN